jgi:hypothetical protein
MFTMPHFAVFVVSFFCFVFPAFMLSYKKKKTPGVAAPGVPGEKKEKYMQLRMSKTWPGRSKRPGQHERR